MAERKHPNSHAPDPTVARRSAWDGYWSTGALHSCPGSFEGNYTGVIGRFWDGVLPVLRPGDRVLDLATGNGALPRRIWEAGRRDVSIDATDLASVSPDWIQPGVHAGIRFRAGVDMCELPYGDGAFDLVVSQFGLEYAARPRAIREALRVASPGGGLALVLHHAGSRLVAVAAVEARHQARLLSPGGLLAAADQVLAWMERARRGEPVATRPEAEGARQAYNAAMADIAGQVEAGEVPDLLVAARDAVHGLLARRDVTADQARRALSRFADEIAAAHVRTSELLSHALDDAGIGELESEVRAAHPAWNVRSAPLAQEEGVLAWALGAGRAAECVPVS